MFNIDKCATMHIIEYCCVVWGHSCNFNAYKIEKLRRRSCKLIPGNYYTTIDAARKQLGMLSYEESIFVHKAKVMYKLANNTAPIYLTDLLKEPSREKALLTLHVTTETHFYFGKKYHAWPCQNV